MRKLNRKEKLILCILLEHGELTGMEIVRYSNGEVRKGPDVYQACQTLERRGLVDRHLTEPSDEQVYFFKQALGRNPAKRHSFSITDAGREALLQ